MDEGYGSLNHCALPSIIRAFFSSPKELNILTGLCVIFGLQTIILNCTILKFYSKATGKNRVIPYLYTVIPTFDLLCGVMGFLNAGHFAILNSDDLHDVICVPLSRGTHVLDKKLVMLLSYLFTAYLTVTSAFLHTMLTVVRCLNITLPFYQPILGQIKRALYFYLCVMGLMVLGEITYVVYTSLTSPGEFTESYFYYIVFVRLVSLVKLEMIASGASSLTFRLHVGLDLVLPFVLPCLICTICLVVLVYKLVWRRRAVPALSGNKNESVRSHYHITGTVTLLTAHFVFCNSVLVVIVILQKHFNSLGRSLGWHGKAAAVAFCIVPLFNAAINPLIFISRSSALKAYIRSRFASKKRMFQSLGRSLSRSRSQLTTV